MAIPIRLGQTTGSMRRSLALFVSCLALILLTAPARAQLKEVIDVSVTNIEFVATDSKGRPVTGLTRDDFELFENGQPQKITNFFESVGATPGNERRSAGGRRLVLYFDDSSLLQHNRHPIIPAAKKLLADTMTPEDQVMIVTFNQTMSVRLPWSSDLRAVTAMIDEIGKESGGGAARQAERARIERQVRDILEENQYAAQPQDEGTPSAGTSVGGMTNTRAPLDFNLLLSSARSYATGVQRDFGKSAIALEGLFSSLSAVDGRKIVIIASESLPTRPGSEIFTYLDQIRTSIITGNVNRTLKRSAQNANVSAEAASFNTTEAVVALGRLANAAGITVYALDPDTGNRSSSGNVERMDVQSMEAGVQGSRTDVDGLQMLTKATGGVAWISAKPTVALENIRSEIENYYSIGYSGRSTGPVERPIEIRSKRADVRVRARKSVVFRSTEAEMPQRVVSNLQSEQMNDLGISIVIAGPIEPQGTTLRVPLQILIPAQNLTLNQEGDALTGGFSVYVCTAGGEAAPSRVQRQTHAIKWPLAVADGLKERDVTYALEVVLEEGRSLISIGVLDHNSQATGFSKTEI